MNGYLGEFDADVANPYADYSSIDWALEYNLRYSQIDGAHHKQWVLDQIARILLGTPVILKVARWDNGEEEYRFHTGEPSSEYLNWVLNSRGEFDENTEQYEYDYDEGIPP